MSNELHIERIGASLVVQLTRPAIRNPLSVTVLEQLHSLVAEVRLEPTLRKIIFTGTDAVFASGANLREIAALKTPEAREFAIRGQSLMSAIAALHQTTIAAVNGFCFGGALDLALACNRRIASPSAQFSHPGTGLGIITGWGGTQRLPRLVGEGHALEMFFTAAPIDAPNALRIGLIDEIAADPLAAAFGYEPSSATSPPRP